MNTESFSIDSSTVIRHPRAVLALLLFAAISKNTSTVIVASLVFLIALLMGTANAYRPHTLIQSLDETLRSTKRALYHAMDEVDGTRDLSEFTTKHTHKSRLQCKAAGLRKRSLEASISWKAELFSLFSGLVKDILMGLEEAKELP